MEEIVCCRDVIEQEYLMEVIIQVEILSRINFKVIQDDFHLHTLDSFLNATAKLERNVNIKQIVISIIDRFANYAARIQNENSELDSNCL